MSLPESVTNNKNQNLIHRNSQLLQRAAKFGLRRSVTTKLSTSPQIQPRPSTSVSFSSSTNTNNKRYQQQTKQQDDIIPSVPYINFTAKSTTENILSSSSNHQLDTSPPTNNHKMSDPARILPPIPESSCSIGVTLSRQQEQPRYYRAFLSQTAYEMKRRMILSDRIKNNIQYSNVFDGKEAVDKLKEVIGTTDRQVALRVGRALESQRFFHDVIYENRLVDDIIEIYQFNELLFHNLAEQQAGSTTSSSNNSSTDNSISNSPFSVASPNTSHYESEEEDDNSLNTETTNTTTTTNQQQLLLPNGIYTELTRCYSSTCSSISSIYPCYSRTCPNQKNSRIRPHSIDTREKRVTAYVYEIEKDQQLWSQTVDDYIVLSMPANERKRQETIFELIYTEENFLHHLDYVVKMWINPLKTSDIIPKQRRDEFIDKVFSNMADIRNISTRLTTALKARQQQHPIVSQISDIMERYMTEFEPFVYYASRQLQAKHTYEHERFNNPKFALFAERTERDVSSCKLELNGYLTKPTTRLARYTLLLDKIYHLTSMQHPDKEVIPHIIETFKHILQKVNATVGAAKNRFDLEQIHRHLSFKNKKDIMDLRLLDPGRSIVKQGTLRKTASLDSTEYQVILFDHYLVTTKVKIINAVEHYRIQKRPIPIELLGTAVPSDTNGLKRKMSSNTMLRSSTSSPPLSPSSTGNRTSPYSSQQQLDQNSKLGSPITFYHQGRSVDETHTVYAPNEQNRKTWYETILKQRDIKFKRQPVFDVVDCVKRFEFFAEIKTHHMVVFDEGRSYLLATDSGVYFGPKNDSGSGVPRKVLPVEKVYQLHVLEEFQLLLVLSDSTLWQYPLDITINGRPDSNQSIQFFGRKIRNNVTFFHVGVCLGKTLICVPKPSSVNGTEIDLYEPTMPKTEMRKKSLLGRLSIRSSSLSLTNTQVTQLKSIYSPFDVWAIDNTLSMLLLTTPVGLVAVDMKTKMPEALLDPSDRYLDFITRNERIDEQIKIKPAVKRIAIFPVPNGQYLICYDKYAFYINKKGRRSQRKFKIEWEGHPTAFAYHYPHVVAFEHQFIEVRSVIDGHLEQVIQEKNVCSLQNGHKSNDPHILGTMLDKTNSIYQQIFELQPIMTQQ